MDFDLTDEQRMLAETVNSLLDKRYDPSTQAEAARQPSSAGAASCGSSTQSSACSG